MSMRDEFERWAELHIGWNDPELKRDNDDPDMYLMDITQYAWSAWQAAQAPASGEVEPVVYEVLDVEGDHVDWASTIDEAKHEACEPGDWYRPLYTNPAAARQVPEGKWLITGETLYLRLTKDLSGGPDETFVDIEDGDGNSVRIERFEDGNDWLIGPLYEAPKVLTTPTPATTAEAESFQSRVQPWLLECFGAMIAGDKEERNHRFLEEALELVQSLRCTADEAHKLVDYVFSRPVGDPPQEVGGVQVTLAALCLANAMDMHQCGEAELARITQPEMVEKIREKQKRKPSMSPLPGVYPDRPTPPTAQEGE